MSMYISSPGWDPSMVGSLGTGFKYIILTSIFTKHFSMYLS